MTRRFHHSTLLSLDTYRWYSHLLDNKGFGGFTLYNDGSTTFRSDQEIVFQFNMAGVDVYW